MSEITTLKTRGERFKEARKTLRLKQKESAEKLGLQWFSVRDIESGKKQITPELAQKIEDVLGVDLRWLLTGEGKMFIRKDTKDATFKLDPDEIKELGLRLQQLRDVLHITPQEAADAFGVTLDDYLLYETGKSAPTTRSIGFFEVEYHVSDEWLMQGSGEMFEAPDDEPLSTELEGLAVDLLGAEKATRAFMSAANSKLSDEEMVTILEVMEALPENRRQEVIAYAKEKQSIGELDVLKQEVKSIHQELERLKKKSRH